MCGIYGIVSWDREAESSIDELESMGRLLRHRGPDGHGTSYLRHAALGAERLRVFDPTHSGDQPFVDPTGQVALVLNGAIYNWRELRARYPRYPFRSRTDAEAVLPLYLERGGACVTDLDGMFALAIYDGRSDRLLLARDRAGEKPLFYGIRGSTLRFASEVQPLLRSLERLELDRTALRQFAILGYICEPRTAFSGLRKLEAGTVLEFDASGVLTNRYWDPAAEAGCGEFGVQTPSQLEELLLQAVSKQLAADVPVGVFTSGGVDSALLTALAVRACGRTHIRTFTVGFVEPSYDESRHAEWLARALGTDHETVVTTEQVLLDALHSVVEAVAEPIADPAVLPTYVLARRARRDVTVVLSGEGADELFGGYPTYLGHRLAETYDSLPRFGRRALSWAIRMTPSSESRKVPLEYLLKRFVAAAGLPLEERHIRWFGTGIDPSLLSSDTDEKILPRFPQLGDALAAAASFDYCTYLRDNLLTKVDRATMLWSLEARAPYLDQDVSRFGLSLGSRSRLRGVRTKWLLKKVAERWLPRGVVHRRKRGLSLPVGQWLNGVLSSEVDRLLSPDVVGRRGLVRPEAMQRMVAEHRRGRANHSRALWPMLILEYWLERWAPEA